MIFMSHNNSNTSQVASCVKISDGSLQCLKFSYTRQCLHFHTTTGDLIAGPSRTQIILCLPATILIESQE